MASLSPQYYKHYEEGVPLKGPITLPANMVKSNKDQIQRTAILQSMRACAITPWKGKTITLFTKEKLTVPEAYIVPKLDDDSLLLLEGLVTVRVPTTVEWVLIPKGSVVVDVKVYNISMSTARIQYKDIIGEMIEITDEDIDNTELLDIFEESN